MSLYQIAQIINRVGGYDPDCLMGIPRRQAGPIPPRAGNVCMDCTKLIAAVGDDPFDPWPYCDTLVPTHAEWHRERPRGEPLAGTTAPRAGHQSERGGRRGLTAKSCRTPPASAAGHV